MADSPVVSPPTLCPIPNTPTPRCLRAPQQLQHTAAAPPQRLPPPPARALTARAVGWPALGPGGRGGAHLVGKRIKCTLDVWLMRKADPVARPEQARLIIIIIITFIAIKLPPPLQCSGPAFY